MCFLSEPFKHDLFVSYSHGDFDGSGRSPLKEWSLQFVAELERQLRTSPLFRDVCVFLDQNRRPGRGIDPTEPLTEQLAQEISATALFVVLMTPQYLGSTWCAQERDWWLGRNVPDSIGAGSRSFVCRVLPNVTKLPWKPDDDDETWPDALKDSAGHALPGFWFHATQDVDFATVPFRWAGSTDDVNEFNKALRLLIRHITIRLNGIKQKLDEQRREEENRKRLIEPSIKKIIYLHAREGQRQVWQDARRALESSGCLVYPAAPEPNLLEQPLLDLKTIRTARQRRILQLAESDAILVLCSAGAELEIDLPAIGRNDRESARDVTGKLLPCAVLDQVGQPIDAAIALGIERLDIRQPGWEMHILPWLESWGRRLEMAA